MGISGRAGPDSVGLGWDRHVQHAVGDIAAAGSWTTL